MSVLAIPEPVTIKIAGQPDQGPGQGKLREENRAVASHTRTQFGDLLVLADAIGDAAAASEASRKAADIISSRIEAMPAFFPSQIAVEEAIRQASTELTAMATVPDSPYSSVGVTVIVALLRTDVDRAHVTIGRVGDSRAYLVRDRKLALLTRNPSATPNMPDRKWTSPQEEVEPYPDPSMPARGQSKGLNLDVEMRELPLKAGDTLLLCSDGFSSRVSEREIERVLADEARSVEEASRALLNLALSAGGAGGRENLAIEIARLARRTREPRRTREADYAENESPIPPRSPHAAEAPASEPETIEKPQAEIPLFRSFRSGIDVERDVERGQTRSSKWLMILSVVLAIPMLCVLIFMVVKAHSGAPFDPNLVTQPPSAAGDNQPQPNTQDPSHQVKVTVDQVPAGTAAEPASNSQPSNNERAVKPTEAQTETPTETSAGTSQDQPAAQTRIPPGSKQRAAANVPSSATSARAHAERPSGNEDTRPADREEASRPVAVSAEAAAGRLIESRIAIYPPVAKASGISGTVELEATISEDGTVKDLRAVSGPVQLRQAAVHAVSAWRYRPFMANNEPMEVRTTINVVFSLDR